MPSFARAIANSAGSVKNDVALSGTSSLPRNLERVTQRARCRATASLTPSTGHRMRQATRSARLDDHALPDRGGGPGYVVGDVGGTQNMASYIKAW